jgi:hypothetical protein
MEALQVEYGVSLAGLIETDLLNGPATVRVWNTGVSGWSPNQYYLRAVPMLASREWDGVLAAIYVGNDVVSARTDSVPRREASVVHRLRAPRSLRWSELIDAVLYPVNDFLEVRSHLFVLFKRQMRTVLMAMELTAADFDYWYYREAADHPGWQVSIDLLHDIATKAAERGVPVLFALVPSAFQVDPSVFDEYARGLGIDPTVVDLEQPTRIFREGLETRGHRVVDLLPGLRVALATRGPLYGDVDQHLTANGHRVAFELLRGELARMLEDPQ